MMVTFRSRAMSISASTAFVGALLWATAHTTIKLPDIQIHIPEPESYELEHEALPPPVDPVRKPIEPQTKADDEIYVETTDDSAAKDPPTPIDAGPPAAASTLVNPTWIRKPTIDDLLGFYPSGAIDRGIDGHVMLDCVVAANGRLTCNVAAESPTGLGFGRAALRASRLFQIAPQMQDGKPTEGGRISVAIAFKAPVS
jgi:protein TonB